MMDDPEIAWKLVNLLWGALFGLAFIVGRYVWNKLEKVESEVDEMKFNAVQNHVTKADMKEAFEELIRYHIAPLNRDISALIRALRAQEIHVDHSDRS